jgi:hypothetical protein
VSGKQQLSLGRVIHVRHDPQSPWRVGLVIEVFENAQGDFNAAMFGPREQRMDLMLTAGDEGVYWRWPPFVAPKAG